MRTAGDLKKGSRSEYWRELIDQQDRSGQPVRAFCSKHRITEQSFYSWRKRLSGEGPVRFALVAAEGSGSKQDTALELDLGCGQRLRIPFGVDAASLRTVLAVLRERV